MWLPRCGKQLAEVLGVEQQYRSKGNVSRSPAGLLTGEFSFKQWVLLVLLGFHRKELKKIHGDVIYLMGEKRKTGVGGWMLTCCVEEVDENDD